MRGWLTAAFILGVSVALGAQQPTFRSGTQTVPLYITVTDASGRLVPNLTKEDFTVLDNGIPQEISVFDNTVRPITSVVMLDTSGSMTLNLDLMKAAAEQFIIRLLPEDKAVVGAFNNKVEFAGTGFTNDRDDLADAIRELDYGNATRLWDAVDLSLEQLQGIDGRRVIVVFTDGDDTGSSSSQGKIIDRARADEVMIYAIGLESVYRPARPHGAHAPGRRPAEDRGRDRRRLLRAEEDRRARPGLHPRRPGAAQPVPARLHAEGPRWQGAQARGPPQGPQQQGARPPQLSRHAPSISPRRAESRPGSSRSEERSRCRRYGPPRA